jgi:hypothetical protein
LETISFSAQQAHLATGAAVAGVRESVAGARESLPVSKSEPRKWLEIVERQVQGLKFSSVQVTLHEGRVVQIERSAKIRFDRS